jgi:hypothetical protein
LDKEPIDAIGPWTVKAVSTETRNRVTVAARKEGLTVGQWLERRVNEWLEDGGPVRVIPGQPGNGQGFARVSPLSLPGSDRSELSELVKMARDLSPADQPDAPLLRLARGVVRDRLKALRLPKPPAPTVDC